MTRKEYFDTLLSLFEKHIEATRYPDEYEIEMQIFAFIECNEVPKDALSQARKRESENDKLNN